MSINFLLLGSIFSALKSLKGDIERIVDELVRVHNSVQRCPEFMRCTGEHDLLTLDVVLCFLQLDDVSGFNENMHKGAGAFPLNVK